MTRVDLDAIEEMAATYNSILLRLNVPALVAELRAAREVVEEADSLRSFLSPSIIDKIDAYFEVVGS